MVCILSTYLLLIANNKLLLKGEQQNFNSYNIDVWV